MTIFIFLLNLEVSDNAEGLAPAPRAHVEVIKLEKGSVGGGGGREERRKGVGDGLLRVASCQSGNSANSWERAVCVRISFFSCCSESQDGTRGSEMF